MPAVQWLPRSTLLRLGAFALAVTSTACGFLIGLDERPARPGVDAGEVDAGTKTDASGRFCTSGSGALLCDDFDDPGQRVSARWPGVPSFNIKSPGISHDASIDIVENENATSLPRSLEVNLESGSTALLAAEFDGGVAGAGFVVGFDLQLPEFSDQRPADAGGPIESGPDPVLANQTALGVGGYATVTEQFKEYGGFLGVSGADILLTEAIAGEDTANYVLVAHANLNVLGGHGWLRITLATGPRDRVVSFATSQLSKSPDCPADAAYVTAAWVAAVAQSGCVRADETMSPVARRRPFALLLGGSSVVGITARLRFDSVRLDALP